MEPLVEEILVYSFVAILTIATIYFYVKRERKKTAITENKILRAKEFGLYEPVSLHPVIDHNCIGTGACITACPEHDILGLLKGKAAVINTSQCIGHGACFQACPTQAISLFIGTEKRGVDLPNIDKTFETNVQGIYIAGELGGMGLIRNAVEQGKQAVQNIMATIDKNHGAEYDLIIVGAGPAGISGALTAKMGKIKAVILEQESLGGTVFTYPRSKIIMTAPMDLPLYGKLKLYQTSKTELLTLWKSVIAKHNIEVRELTKVEVITKEGTNFSIKTKNGGVLSANKVLLALGRRGTPRKLNIPGEEM